MTWKSLGEFLLKRFKNPLYVGTIIIACGTQVLTYYNMNPTDLTSFAILLNLIEQAYSTPAVWIETGVYIFGITVSFDTKGIKDGVSTLLNRGE